MRKLFLLLPVVALIAFTWATGASADSQGFTQDFHGETGNLPFETLQGICDECFPDDLDVDPGFSGIGFQDGIEGNFTWDATNDSFLSYTGGLIRQGSTLDALTTTFAIAGSATVNYHIFAHWGLFNDPDGAGPLDWQGTIFTSGADMWFTSTIPCDLPLQAGTSVCSKDEYFEVATIHVPPIAQLKMRLKFHTEVTIDSTGVIGVRVASVEAGPPLADTPIVYGGADPGLFSDPLFIGCDQPAGQDLTYSYNDVHLTADTIEVNQNWALNFAVTDFLGTTTIKETDALSGATTDAHFNDGITLTTPDQSFVLGKVAADFTPPTIQPMVVFNGVEGAPVQLWVAADDNCGPPTVRWDFSDGGVAFGLTPQHTFSDNGYYTGLVTATDVKGLTTTAAFAVNVTNAPPTVAAGPDKTFDWGRAVPLHANGADAGGADWPTLQYSWSFGDPFDPLGAAGQDAVHYYAAPGLYTAVVSVSDKDGATGADAVEVTVTKRDTTLGYTGAQAGRITDTVDLKAALVDEYGEPVVGRSVRFTVDGTPVGTAVTDENGVAVYAWTIPVGMTTGTHPVDVGFAGDAFYKGALSNGGLATLISVQKEAGVLTYTGVSSGKNAKALPLSAKLTDDEGVPVAGKTVVLTVAGQSCSGVTDGSGVATCTITKLSAKQGLYQVAATFSGDADYLAASDLDPFVVGN